MAATSICAIVISYPPSISPTSSISAPLPAKRLPCARVSRRSQSRSKRTRAFCLWPRYDHQYGECCRFSGCRLLYDGRQPGLCQSGAFESRPTGVYGISAAKGACGLKDVLRPILELTVVFPGLLLAYFPVRSYLKQSSAKLAVWEVPLLFGLCLGGGLFCYHFGISTAFSVLLITLTAIFCIAERCGSLSGNPEPSRLRSARYLRA